LETFCQDEVTALRRCRRGSRDAFEPIVKRYMKDAYFIALGLVGNREDALDLSQEAFIRAFSNIKQLNPDKKFFPWFYQILKNLCFSHLRKRRTRQDCSLDAADDDNNRQGPVAVDDLFTPDVLAERNEVKKKIWKAIGRLDEKHREVIILRHFRNMSYEQMAQNLFCNKGTVTSRLYYARKRLKELLGKEMGGSTNDVS